MLLPPYSIKMSDFPEAMSTNAGKGSMVLLDSLDHMVYLSLSDKGGVYQEIFQRYVPFKR